MNISKIEQYVVVEGVAGINHYLTLGWELFGIPMLHPTSGVVNQAMIMYCKPEVPKIKKEKV